MAAVHPCLSWQKRKKATHFLGQFRAVGSFATRRIAPHLLNDRYAEVEYVIDRAQLHDVRMLARYSQLSHQEYRQLNIGEAEPAETDDSGSACKGPEKADE